MRARRRFTPAIWLCATCAVASLTWASCFAAASLSPPASAPAPHLSALAALGKTLFFDRSLSSSGRLACANCHDPANAYAAPRAAGPVMLGGAHMDLPGRRAVPSLRYLQHVPLFTRHLYLSRTDDPEDVGPGGGLMWDGRASTLAAQALVPLLDAREMANLNVHELAARLRASNEAGQLRTLQAVRPGHAAQESDARLADLAALALARFELEDPSFHPYDSRYDAYLEGTGSLTTQELRGLELFNSADKGNCAECHPSTPGPAGRPPDFTDFRFAVVGVPRNPALAVNRRAGYYDLGLCGPLRTDLFRESAEYCGMFRTPTLRNTARRGYFFHNGRFTTLEQVVRFYVTRDLDPARWYPARAGHIDRYDDLPPIFRVNIDRTDPPFDRRAGQAPALSDAEIADVVAFLRTLDDRS